MFTVGGKNLKQLVEGLWISEKGPSFKFHGLSYLMQFENSLLQSHGCGAAERHLGEAHGTENAVLNDLCRGASDPSRICSRASRQDQSQLERERDALLENNIDEFLATPRPLVKKVFLDRCGETES